MDPTAYIPAARMQRLLDGAIPLDAAEQQFYCEHVRPMADGEPLDSWTRELMIPHEPASCVRCEAFARIMTASAVQDAAPPVSGPIASDEGSEPSDVDDEG